MGFLSVPISESLNHVPSLGLLSSCLFVLPNYDVLLIVLFHFIIIHYKPVCFLMRSRKDVDLDGKGGREELRGVELGETAIRIYCIRI